MRLPARLRRSRLLEWGLVIAIALGLALAVQSYAVKPYRIPSGSMEPTLQIGDRVLVDRFSHNLGSTPGVGEIVVFHPPAGADDFSPQCGISGQGVGTEFPCSRPSSPSSSQTFIKRVVGVGGDRIAIHHGHVVRNGRLQAEPFTSPCGSGSSCNFPHAITVPDGYVYVMGDNRGESQDSRFWGPVPVSWVIGKAVLIYWPPGEAGAP